MSAPKQLWVLAGGNGAGKSTFYNESLLKKSGMKFINSDMIAEYMDSSNTEEISYQAAYIADQIREEFLSKNISFCFETVFSHPSKIDFLARAKAQGYEIILVYIHLDAPALNEARVKQRVSEGGHNVPREKIYSRIPRTMENIATTLQLVDKAKIYDNSLRDKPFQEVASISQGRVVNSMKSLPDWAKEILKNIIGP